MGGLPPAPPNVIISELPGPRGRILDKNVMLAVEHVRCSKGAATHEGRVKAVTWNPDKGPLGEPKGGITGARLSTLVVT